MMLLRAERSWKSRSSPMLRSRQSREILMKGGMKSSERLSAGMLELMTVQSTLQTGSETPFSERRSSAVRLALSLLTISGISLSEVFSSAAMVSWRT